MTGILIMGPYKPLRTWVDDHPLLYGNNGSLDPSTYTTIDIVCRLAAADPLGRDTRIPGK